MLLWSLQKSLVFCFVCRITRLLYKAVENDDVDSLQKHLWNVHDVETKTALLLSAVRTARYHCIQQLMAAGCDPLLKFEGTNAVQCAIIENDMKALLLLVGQQSLDVVDIKPMEVSNESQRLWYDNQRSIDEALFIASGLGNVDAVETLLKYGASPNCCFYYDDEFVVTCSTLVSACLAPLRHLAADNAVASAELVVHTLVNSGANVNRRCSTGMTPLHWAVKAGLVQSLTHLVKSGADVNARRANDGLTPLMMAVERDLTSVTTLISAGADIDATDFAHYTALCHAVNAQSLPTAEYLLEQGANPDGCDFVTTSVPFLVTTPLYLATSIGSRAMAVLLLKFGANLHRTVGMIQSRSTVFHVALCVNNFDLVGVFLAAGFDRAFAYKLVSGHIDDICGKVPAGMTRFLSLDERIRLQHLEKLHFELSQPQMLKHLCRITIRQNAVSRRQICKLPLPSALCSFLLFDDL